MPVFIVMNLLSGSNAPFDSMPVPVQRRQIDVAGVTLAEFMLTNG
jgi:hypothetical protein